MNYRIICRTLGFTMLIEAILMLPSVFIAIYHGESTLGFFAAISLLLVCSALCIAFKPKRKDFYAREGLVCVALSWIVLSLFGALPFYIEGMTPDYISAVFETVSGFTTTGATTLTSIEGCDLGLLFWRSFTHWIGGMGILVFTLAVLPKSDERSMHFARAEMPGPVKSKLVPRMRDTALILYSIYIALTIVEVILLLAGGMPLYDAAVHSFGTAGTGGFSIKNASIAYYDSAYIDVVISVFMLLFSVNFNLYFLLLLKDFRSVFKNEEMLWFFGIVAATVAVIAIDILPLYRTAGESIRYALFQVSSIISTTGYSTANFDQWPELSRILLVFIMLIGACAGSTGGGLKVSRIIILLKSSVSGIRRMLHPRSVNTVRLDGVTLPDETVLNTQLFFSLYILLICFSAILVAAFDECDFTTNLTGVIACISNIGPGLGAVGPVGNFSSFSAASKIIFVVDMLLGRLEIFPIIVLFSPATWKRV